MLEALLNEIKKINFDNMKFKRLKKEIVIIFLNLIYKHTSM